MPITYSIHKNGHFLHARITPPLAREEFISYEVDHAINEQVRPPLDELMEIERDACRDITEQDMAEIIRQRTAHSRRPIPHHCAIVVAYDDAHTWNLAIFYKVMATLHAPKSVIVFGDLHTARLWLGVTDLFNDVVNHE